MFFGELDGFFIPAEAGISSLERLTRLRFLFSKEFVNHSTLKPP